VGGPSRAFVRGGCGCILGFLCVGIVVVALGGSAHADLGGLVLLFLIGGAAGLCVYAVSGSKKPRERPLDIQRPPGPWTCGSCGAVNAEAMSGCVACGEPR
jgi:hypothetical protein